MTQTPANLNLLQGNSYQIAFDALPNTQYFCKSCNLPGLTLGSVDQNTPLSVIRHPGDVVEFDTLNIEFLVDEDLQNWLELFDWMLNLGFGKDIADFSKAVRDHSGPAGEKQLGGGVEGATLTIQTNKRNANISVQYDCVWPTSLSEIVFSTEDVDERTATATFYYTTYAVTRLSS